MTAKLHLLEMFADRVRSPDWTKEAMCFGLDVDTFFVEGRRNESLQARRICVECPVRIQCLSHGIDEEFGVWGGTISRDRGRIKRRIRDGKPIEPLLKEIDNFTREEYQAKYGWPLDTLVRRLGRKKSKAGVA